MLNKNNAAFHRALINHVHETKQSISYFGVINGTETKPESGICSHFKLSTHGRQAICAGTETNYLALMFKTT